MDKEEQEMGKGVAAPADPVAKRPFLSGTGKGNFCKSAAGWQGNTVSVPG